MPDIVNKIIRGTFGRLWIDGELLANIKSFECKATMNYETLKINGEMCDQQRYLGYALAGTMTLHKINTLMVNKVRAGMINGQMPPIKLVGALADVDSDGSERIEIYNVTFDEVTLLKFENGTVGEEEVPFKAGGFKYLDTI